MVVLLFAEALIVKISTQQFSPGDVFRSTTNALSNLIEGEQWLITIKLSAYGK